MSQAAPNPRPAAGHVSRRLWPHASTWLVCVLTAAVLLLANLPGDRTIRYAPDRQNTVEHGWPAVYLRRRIESDGDPENPLLSLWPWDGNVVAEEPASAALDAAVALVILLAVAVGFETWRRSRTRVWSLSLREFLLAMSLVCALLGWWGWRYRETQQSLHVLNALGHAGPVTRARWRLDGPTWLRECLGVRGVYNGWPGSVVSLDCESFRPADEEPISLAARFPHLRRLSLWNERISPRQAARLRELPELEVLSLTACDLRDGDLEHIAALRKLVSLNLSHNDITNDGLRRLTVLHNLKLLEIANTQITDEGVAALRAKLLDVEVLDD